MTHVIIVDDHHIIIDGISTMLQTRDNYRVLGTASNGMEGLELLRSFPETDIVITDINMPVMNGLELCHILKRDHQDIKVMFLTMYNNETIINNALDVEADGIILKNSGMRTFFEALEKVCDGGTYYDQEILPFIRERIHNEKWLENREMHNLSQREREILEMIAQEMTSVQIADHLFISKRTVDKHRDNMMRKTGCKSTVGLVKYALRLGMCI